MQFLLIQYQLLVQRSRELRYSRTESKIQLEIKCSTISDDGRYLHKQIATKQHAQKVHSHWTNALNTLWYLSGSRLWAVVVCVGATTCRSEAAAGCCRLRVDRHHNTQSWAARRRHVAVSSCPHQHRSTTPMQLLMVSQIKIKSNFIAALQPEGWINDAHGVKRIRRIKGHSIKY